MNSWKCLINKNWFCAKQEGVSREENLLQAVIQFFCFSRVRKKNPLRKYFSGLQRFLFVIYNSFISIAWNKNARSFHSNMDCICISLPCTNVCYFTNKHRFREYSKAKNKKIKIWTRVEEKKNIRLYIHSTFFYDIWKKCWFLQVIIFNIVTMRHTITDFKTKLFFPQVQMTIDLFFSWI